MRRSYDYWIITFAIACFILVFAQLFHKKEQERWDALKGALSNLAVLFGLGALIVFCFFEYFRSALSLNVRFAYQAWSITVGQNAWLDFCGITAGFFCLPLSQAFFRPAGFLYAKASHPDMLCLRRSLDGEEHE